MKFLNSKIYKLKTTPRGFTLVEMLVATALFAVVMTISAGALVSIVSANKKSQSLKTVMNNLNFALENMSRNIRVGTNYHCGDVSEGSSPSFTDISLSEDCTGNDSGNLIAFRRRTWQLGDALDVYWFDKTELKIKRSIPLESSPSEQGLFLDITSPEIVIDDLKFYVSGSSNNDLDQPRVLMTLKGHTGENVRTRAEFNLQTTISQRLLDN